jgi:hypothetical protein
LNQTRTLIAYLLLSFIAAVLIVFFVVIIPSNGSLSQNSEKTMVAGVFIFCGIGGISFTLRPNWVRRYITRNQTRESRVSNQINRSFRGHHPDCTSYQDHTVHWRKTTWCAGCLGLLIGFCVSILLMILYLIIDFHLIPMVSYLFLFLGFLILTSVFLEALRQSRHPMVHLLSNSMLPLSFALLTITVEDHTGKFAYGFFTIVLCFLWLDTRIHLSKRNHRRLCLSCSESCKMYMTTG